MKTDISDRLASISVRLSVIATDISLAFSLCKSKEALEKCIRNKSSEIHSLAKTLLNIAKEGGAQ